MQTLITKLETQVIIYKDRGFDYISDEEANFIYEASSRGEEGCKLRNGHMVTFSTIGRIIDIEKFYDENPERRPEEVRDTFKDNYGNQQVRNPTTFQAELMHKGFIDCRMSVFGETREVAEEKFRVMRGNLLGTNPTEYHKSVVEKYRDKERTEEEDHHYQHSLKKLNPQETV